MIGTWNFPDALNTKIHFHFPPLLNAKVAHVVKMLPRGEQGIVYPAYTMSLLLMAWQRKGFRNDGIDLLLLEYSSLSCEGLKGLTHCGLVTPYGVGNLSQHWLRQWLVAWRHQAITRTNVDWSSVKSNDIHIREISQEVRQPSITKIRLKITYLKFHLNFPGANDLQWGTYFLFYARGYFYYRKTSNISRTLVSNKIVDKQRVLMHGHQGWNVRHGLCHIYMIYVYIWVVYSFCLFCLFIIVTTQFVALYKPCKPKPSTYDSSRG